MKIEEAIKVLEKQFDKSCGNYRYQNAEKIDFEDAIWMAIEALKEKKEAEKNEPLTLEEMDKIGTGPIYVVPKDPQLVKKGWKDWCVWDSNEKKAFVPGIAYKTWDIEDYGKEWIAYLREPEEYNHG